MLDDLSVDIEGKVGNPIRDTVLVLQSNRAKFSEYKKGTDVSKWFSSTVEGLRYELQSDIVPPYDKAEVKIYGTPLETQNNVSYDLNIEFGAFIAGTIRREVKIENLGKYKIGEPDAVVLEVLYPQEVQGQINKALPRSYDIVLHLRKDGTRENLRLAEKKNVVLGVSDEDEKNFINRIDGLTYTLNTSKSEGVDYYDTLTVTISGSPSDSKVHTENIQFKVPLKNTYIDNLGQYQSGSLNLKGVNVVQDKKVSYNISEDVPPEFEEAEYVISGTRNRELRNQVIKIKLKDGTGKFYPMARTEFEPTDSYWDNNDRRTYRVIDGYYDSRIKWEWEVKSEEPTTFYIYATGVPYSASFKEFNFNIPAGFIQTSAGVASNERAVVPGKYHIVQPLPKLKFENRQILVGDMDGNGMYQKYTFRYGSNYNEFSYSIDNPNFVNNLYNDKDSLIISVCIENSYEDGLYFETKGFVEGAIEDNVLFTDTIEYKGQTIPNPLKGKNLKITFGEIIQEIVDKDYGGRPTYKYTVTQKFTGNGMRDRFAFIIEIPQDTDQGDTPVQITDDLIPICLKVGARAFEQAYLFDDGWGVIKEELYNTFMDENGNPAKDGEQVYYEVSAGENDENRSYVGVFYRKYTPYIADGAAVTYYEDYYTEAPFKAEDKLLIIRPRLSDNASMTKNGGVPITYQTDSNYPNRIGAININPTMDPAWPTHILSTSFPDVSAYTRRGFKKVGWSTVMGSGLVDYSTPLNGDNGGQPYKNTIENVAQWGLWLPRSAGYVWPTPIDYPVSLACILTLITI